MPSRIESVPEPKLGESRTALDVAEIIASRRFGRFQLGIVVLCTLALFSAGFATQMMSALAPAVARSMGVNPGALEPIFRYGGYGILIGLLLFAPLADWIGRKPVLLGSMALFTVLTLASVWAQTVTQLAVLRFVTGIGLGAIVPSTLAITADYMPRRSRAMLTLVVWYGFAVGSGVAGPIAAYTLTNHRWPAVFVLAGFLPVILLPVLWTGVPESLLLLVRRGEQANLSIRAGLIRISRRYDRLRVSEFTTSETMERGVPLLMLFQRDRAPITILLWIVFFTGLLAIFFVNAWTPSVLKTAEYSEFTANIVAGLMQFGGMLGGIGGCYLAGRLDRFLAIGAAFVLGALSIIALSLFSNSLIVAAALFLVGFFVFGAQNAATAIAAASYPSFMRATGAGWALGIGRTGQIIAPTVGGYVLLLKWNLHHLLDLVAVPTLIAGIAAIAIASSGRHFGRE